MHFGRTFLHWLLFSTIKIYNMRPFKSIYSLGWIYVLVGYSFARRWNGEMEVVDFNLKNQFHTVQSGLWSLKINELISSSTG